MAEQLLLVKRPDLASVPGNDVSSLNLLPYLADDGWRPSIADDDNPIDEALMLHISGASIDHLATNVQAFDLKSKETGFATSPIQTNGVWLRAQLDGETNARQVYVMAMKRKNGAAFGDSFLQQRMLSSYELGIKRMPYWETTTSVNLATGSPINVNGGTLSYTLKGDVAGRVAKMWMTAQLNSLQSLNRFWIGVQDSRYGNPANFVPVWSMRGSAAYGDVYDTTESADATAVSGYKQVCTFSTVGTMALRCRQTLESALGYAGSSAWNDQRGIFRVLLRAKTTSTRTARVRLGVGFYANVTQASNVYNARCLISNTNWHYYDLGIITIPAWKVHTGIDVRSQTLLLQAENVSGSGNLEIDALILVPAEHQIYIESTAYAVLNSSVGPDYGMDVFHFPDGQLMAIIRREDGSYPYPVENVLPSQVNWGLPSGIGKIVVVATGANSLNSQAMNLSLDVYERYAMLRGAQ